MIKEDKKKIEKPIYSDEDEKIREWVKTRIDQLKKTKQNVFGVDFGALMTQADSDYVPHRLKKKGKKVLVSDDEKGWRSHFVKLGADDWQTDSFKTNPFIKINTALSILIDKNPEAVFTPDSSKYEETTALQGQLHKKSWEVAKSKQQLKIFAHNLARYGWAPARTYPLIIKRPVRELMEYNADNPEKNVYKTKEAIEYNGVFREALNPKFTWIDDATKPNNVLSTRDWAFMKQIPYDALKEQFGTYKNFKAIGTKKSADVDIDVAQASQKTFVDETIKNVYFYENRIKDLFVVMVDGIMIVNEPLPISDGNGNKLLSLWHTYWNLRHSESPYGIGIPEIIRSDNILYNKLRNMTMDQLILSIYKMFFYSGTNQLDESGTIKLTPGMGKQMDNPQNLVWLDIKPPPKDAWAGVESIQGDIDEESGVTKPLSGEVVAKTAYQQAEATEFSLRRLKTPLDNITDALEQDAIITQSLNELIYSIPELVKITDKNLVSEYLEEIQSDPDLYEVDDAGEYSARLYPEVQLGLEEDEEGNLIESEQNRFFRMKPKLLKWSGMIRVKGQSILAESKTMLRELKTGFANLVVPLLSGDPTINLKPLKQLCKVHDEDWKEWAPETWIEFEKTGGQGGQQELIVPQAGGEARGGEGSQIARTPTIVPRGQTGATGTRNMISKAGGFLGRIFGGAGR